MRNKLALNAQTISHTITDPTQYNAGCQDHKHHKKSKPTMESVVNHKEMTSRPKITAKLFKHQEIIQPAMMP